MSEHIPDHYATLGLDRRCSLEQIRAAYRLLAKAHHPDINPASPDALERTQSLNAACETLSDPQRRRAYDRELAAAEKEAAPARGGRLEKNINQDVHLRIDEFLRGTQLEIRVNDPANPSGPETYPLDIPADTAPGARFRVPRGEPFQNGCVNVRLRARPDARFKIRGSDLRADLRISAQRATAGGSEQVRGVTGTYLRVQIPSGVARGEFLQIPGEGLPKPRGGRGDLLLRVTYRPEVRITRK